MYSTQQYLPSRYLYISLRYMCRWLIVPSIVVALLNLLLQPVSAGPKQWNSGETRSARIAITNFEAVGAPRRDNAIGRGFAQLLSVALLGYPNVHVVSRSEILKAVNSAELRSKSSSAPFDFGLEQLSGEMVIERLHTHLILTGRFFGEGSQLTVRISLEDLSGKTRKSHRVGQFSINTRRLVEHGDELALAVIRTLANIGAIKFKHRKILIACFQDYSAKSTADSASFSDDIAWTLFGFLQSQSRTRSVTWEKKKDACIGNQINPNWQLLDADAVVGGSILVKEGNILVNPVLFIRDGKQSIKARIPTQKSDLTDFLFLKEKTASLVEQLVHGLLNNEGEWELYGLRSIRANPSAKDILTLLQIGKFYAGRSTDQRIDDLSRIPRDRGQHKELAYFFFNWALMLAETSAGKIEYSEFLPDIYLNLGRIFLQQDKISDAANHFNLALQEKPDFTDAHIALGDLYLQRNDYKAAITAYNQAIEVAPKNVEPYERIAQIHLLRDDYEAATAVYQKLAKASPNNPSVKIELGSIAFEFEQFEVARKLLEEARKLTLKNDQKSRVNTLLATTYFRIGSNAWRVFDATTAIENFTNSLKVEIRGDTLGERGRVYGYIGQYQKAIDDITESMRLENSETERTRLQVRRALFSAENGDFDGAELDLSTAKVILPRYNYTYLVQGLVNLLRNRNVASIQEFQRAADLRESDFSKAHALENIGIAWLRESAWRRAFDNTTNINSISDRTSWNWLVRAIAADQLGQQVSAQIALDRWHQLKDPLDAEAIRNYLPPNLRWYIDAKSIIVGIP